MVSLDWPLIHALTREVPPERHSARCPCSETLARIERCTCWISHDARVAAEHVAALYAARQRRERHEHM